jgi:M6 family metalloprotease-like protein
VKGRNCQPARARRAGKFHLFLNLSLVLVMLLAAFGTAAAQDSAPVQERFAADPYEQWSDDVFDFVPPTPATLALAQPDGDTVEALLTPAETGGQLETSDGYTVAQDAGGWWTYAQTDGEGKLVPSALRVGKDLPYGIAKKLGQTPSRWLDEDGNDKRDALFEAVKDVQSPNASVFEATAADLAALAAKNYHYVVILAQFQDVKFEPYQTPQYFKDQISGLRTNSTGTVTDLYYEMSYGQFLPEFEVIGPFTLPGNMHAYDYQLAGGKSVSGMITDLGPQLSALGGNWWDQFDNDRVIYSSTYRSVDMVVVLHAGPGKEATGQVGQVWSHASTANYTVGIASSDNRQVRIRGVNTVPAIGFNIGVVAHEMGHTIGEPDYYDTSYRSQGTGDWDLMAGGSWLGADPAGSNPSVLNPFSRINQGWVTPVTIAGTTLGVELRPRTVAPEIVMIPLGGTASSGTSNTIERLYIEHVSNRVIGTIFDKALLNSGLLIWHYDAGGSQTKSASAPARYRMGVMEYDYRDGTQELAINHNRGEPTDPWSDTPLGITPYTTPSTDRNTIATATGSRKTGWHIMNISPIGDTMTFDIVKEADVQAKVGVDRPELLGQPVIAGSGPATFSTRVYNLTAAPLANVKVDFWAKIGSQDTKLAETALATLPAGTPTVATAAWTAPTAGKFEITAKVSAMDGAASARGMARVFARPAKVLVVDDDDGYTAEQAFEGALNALGVPHVVVEKTASLALMQQHELIIWSSGSAGRLEGQLTLSELAALKTYLNAGGKVWFSSPRLAGALAASSPGPVDTAFLRDYLGASYPMSSQDGGGTIYGTGQYIGGNGAYALRNFPGRPIQDFLLPAASNFGTGTMLFSWSRGNFLGTEVIGDAAHNNFHTVFFGFNMSQVISGADRLTLTQQVLDRMGIATVYFDKATYLMQESGAVKVTVHDADLVQPVVTVTSDAQPAGMQVALQPSDAPGTYTGVFNIQKTGSKGAGLKVNTTDILKAVYQDGPDHAVWESAAVLTKVDKDRPSMIYHDLIDNAVDAQQLPVMAVVTDDINVQQVVLYYRVSRTVNYTKLVLPLSAFQAYSEVIPATAVTPAGLEYYVTARDSKGNLTSVGTAGAPNYVVVQPRTIAP